jgi:hypothetical protein
MIARQMRTIAFVKGVLQFAMVIIMLNTLVKALEVNFSLRTAARRSEVGAVQVAITASSIEDALGIMIEQNYVCII